MATNQRWLSTNQWWLATNQRWLSTYLLYSPDQDSCCIPNGDANFIHKCIVL